jgi:CRP-like cAMP-binding protein
MNRLPIAPAHIPQTMRRLAYFQDWPEDSLERLAAGAKIIPLAKNDVLTRKGERLQQLFIVVSGQVRLFIPLPNQCERVLFLTGPGECLGEACLVLDETCPYQAVAGKDSHVLAVDSLVFRRELGRHVDLTRQVLERVSRRFLDTLRDAEICAQRSSVQRVAAYLLQHRPMPEAESFTFKLPARKQDVAAKLGLTQETLSRVLGFLDKQSLIQMMGSEIRVESASHLSRVSSMRDSKDVVAEVSAL